MSSSGASSSGASSSVLSAAAVLVPERTWAPIQAIRSRHDRAFGRWPPHVNLLFPFLPPDQLAAARPRAADALRALDDADMPATLAFSRLGYFRQGSLVTVHAKPDDPAPLVALQAALAKAFPQCHDQAISRGGFHPHITLGQFPSRDADALLKTMQAAWKPLAFEIKEVTFLARGSTTPFAVACSVPLRPDAQERERMDDEALILPSVSPAFRRLFAGDWARPVRRTREWVADAVACARPLPRTRQRLENAVRPFCRVQCRPRAEDAAAWLAHDGLIAFSSSGGGGGGGDAVRYLLADAAHTVADLSRGGRLRTPPLATGALPRAKEAQAAARSYTKCVLWVARNAASGVGARTRAHLLSALPQVASIAWEFDVGELLDRLAADGVVAFDRDDNATYPQVRARGGGGGKKG